MVSQAELRSLSEEARERRLSGPHHDGGSFPLVGYCFDNAFVLYNLLKEKGYNPQLLVGTTERVAADLVQEGIDLESDITEIEDLAGLVHYWVTCGGYHIDIASDSDEHLGNILIFHSLPDTYYLYNNSEQYAKEVIESAYSRRCSYCGAQVKICSHN